MAQFDLGSIAGTPGALAALSGCGHAPASLARHVSGDFGTVGDEDSGYNRRDIRDQCGRVLSAYDLPNGQHLWIITNLTEEGQNDTCLLLPSEY
jgi:hypothetical protein